MGWGQFFKQDINGFLDFPNHSKPHEPHIYLTVALKDIEN